MKCSLLVFVFLSYAAAAGAAEIRGKVFNAQGEAVVGARVTMGTRVRRGPRTEESKQEITGPDGTYTLTGLEPGRYTVTATSPTRNLSVRQVVVIRSASSSLEVDFHLQAEPAPTTGR